MLSKAQEKYIRALKSKKKRYELKQFIIEGEKLVSEAIQEGVSIEKLYIEEGKREQFKPLLNSISDALMISSSEMKSISQMETAPGILAIVKMIDFSASQNRVVLALEGISDPGNLGTIIRTAECFGVDQIWCSADTVDQYNYKTVQASMGSIFRVPIFRGDLYKRVKASQSNVYVSHLKGKNVYDLNLKTPMILLIGSESHGVTEQMSELATELIKIPQQGKVESLNAAMACGILLAEFNRRSLL